MDTFSRTHKHIHARALIRRKVFAKLESTPGGHILAVLILKIRIESSENSVILFCVFDFETLERRIKLNRYRVTRITSKSFESFECSVKSFLFVSRHWNQKYKTEAMNSRNQHCQDMSPWSSLCIQIVGKRLFNFHYCLLCLRALKRADRHCLLGHTWCERKQICRYYYYYYLSIFSLVGQMYFADSMIGSFSQARSPFILEWNNVWRRKIFSIGCRNQIDTLNRKSPETQFYPKKIEEIRIFFLHENYIQWAHRAICSVSLIKDAQNRL